MGCGPHCGECVLEKIGKGFTRVEVGRRYEQTRLLLIGEASGDSEARDSLPFRPYGQSGSLLVDAMREMNISREEVAISNILRCRPPQDVLEGAWYQHKAIHHCVSHYLDDVIKELKPNVILTLGGVAFRSLTEPIKGRSGTLDYIRGYAIPGGGAAQGITVIPTYHPAFLRRGAAHLTPLLQRDLRRAFLIATGRLIVGTHYILDPLNAKNRYQITPSVDEAWEWFRNIDPTRSIYADIETPRSRREDEDDRNSFADRDINLIQFTQRRGEGIALTWRDDYVEIARAILATNNRKVGHNWFGFDLPVLAANGVVVNGIQDDTMLMFHHYHPDLPQNLQAVAQYCGFPFAWKHLSEIEPEFYGCVDVDATCWVDETLSALLERENLWNSYIDLVREFYPSLREMSRRGYPIDEQKRLDLKHVLVKEREKTNAEIKALVPEEVLKSKHARGGYKNPPKLKCEECGYEGREDHLCKSSGDISSEDEEGADGDDNDFIVKYSELAEQNGLVEREVVVGEDEKCRCTKKTRELCPDCAGTGIIPVGTVERRWTALTEFNPNSPHQVKKFMRFLKHPVPKHQKRIDANGEAAETTEVKELERLYAKTKHPIYPLLIQKRQITKIDGTYCEGWKPGRDGRIHTTFTLKPATLQTSSREPNTQNGVKHGKTPFQKRLAKAFAEMQRAELGHVMVNIDAKSFHAQTTACEAGLADYLRLAKIDIHSFVTCHYLKLPERVGLYERADEEMKDIFKHLKKDEKFKFTRDFKAKRCIAEGELVLTNKGLVPIQKITLDHLLWDGVEWVTHAGLIDQGVREVITYDGLTATPDHKVVTESGRTVSLGEAASQMERLHRTGNQGIPMQSPYCDFLEAIARKRQAESANEVRGVRESGDERLSHGYATARGMPSLCPNKVEASGNIRTKIRRDCGEMFCSAVSSLSSLWRTWNNLQVRESECIRSICGKGASARELQRGRDRQNRQQQTLRTGKFEIGYSQRANAQSREYILDSYFEWTRPSRRIRHSLYARMVMENGEERRINRGTNQQSCISGSQGKERKRLEEVSSVGRFARTYDIANAGPRFCFTVSDCLVLNCILGIQFAMGPTKLFNLNPDDFENIAEAKAIHALIMKQLFPGLEVWQNKMRAQAAEEKLLRNRYDVIRRFYDVQRWDRKQQKWVGGDQAEAAVAFLPASNAFGYMRKVIKRIRANGWDERYQLVNSIHDSLVFHCPKALVEECAFNVTREISKPALELIYPNVTPFGLSVEAEATVGESLAEMEEIKFL